MIKLLLILLIYIQITLSYSKGVEIWQATASVGRCDSSLMTQSSPWQDNTQWMGHITLQVWHLGNEESRGIKSLWPSPCPFPNSRTKRNTANLSCEAGPMVSPLYWRKGNPISEDPENLDQQTFPNPSAYHRRPDSSILSCFSLALVLYHT